VCDNGEMRQAVTEWSQWALDWSTKLLTSVWLYATMESVTRDSWPGETTMK